jgi:hypothetical protein
MKTKYMIQERIPGEGWQLAHWAPTFDTKREALAWINDPEKTWETHASVLEIQVEEEEEGISNT